MDLKDHSDNSESVQLTLNDSQPLIEPARAAFEAFARAERGLVDRPAVHWRQLSEVARKTLSLINAGNTRQLQASFSSSLPVADLSPLSATAAVSVDPQSGETTLLLTQRGLSEIETICFSLGALSSVESAYRQVYRSMEPAEMVVIGTATSGWVVTLPLCNFRPYHVTPDGGAENVSFDALQARQDLGTRDLVTKLRRGDFIAPKPDPEHDSRFRGPESERKDEAQLKRELDEFTQRQQGYSTMLASVVQDLARRALEKAKSQKATDSATSWPVEDRSREAREAFQKQLADEPEPDTKCSQCGQALPPKARFCLECGAKVERNPPSDLRVDSPSESVRVPNPARRSPLICIRCGASLEAGAVTCSRCKHAVSAEDSDSSSEVRWDPRPTGPGIDDRRRCPACQGPLFAGAVCPYCGHRSESQPEETGKAEAVQPGVQTPKRAVSEPVPPTNCPSCGRALKPGARFCTGCGFRIEMIRASVAHDSGSQSGSIASIEPPPPPAEGKKFVFGGATKSPDQPGMEPDPALPPSPQPWSLQQQLAPLGDQLATSLRQSQIARGKTPAFERVMRAVLLDNRVYRHAAEDASLQAEAWVVASVIILFGSLVAWVYSRFSISLYLFVATLSTFLLQAISWVARVWIIQAGSARLLNRKAGFNQFFRPIAYAQAPVVLGVIPLIGPLLALWSLVTTSAAVREVTGADTWSAVALAVAGWVGVVIISYFLVSLV